MYEEHDRAKIFPEYKSMQETFGIWREQGEDLKYSLLHRCTKQLRLSIQWKMDGVMCGYLITVAAMPLWLIMLLDVGKMNVKPGGK